MKCNEILKEGSFRGTYFRNIRSNVTNKWYNDSSKQRSDIMGSVVLVFRTLQLINMVLLLYIIMIWRRKMFY